MIIKFKSLDKIVAIEKRISIFWYLELATYKSHNEIYTVTSNNFKLELAIYTHVYFKSNHQFVFP